jgi:hypothetical protein
MPKTSQFIPLTPIEATDDINIKKPTDSPFYSSDITELNDQIMASKASSLLYILNQKYNGRILPAFRISYNPFAKTMKLKIPSKIWFDDFLFENEKKVEISRKWINEIKSRRVDQSIEIPSNSTFTLPTNSCHEFLNCKHWIKNKCNRKHTPMTCTASLDENNSTNCTFYIPKESVLHIDEQDTRFVLMVRQDENLSRDILFVPQIAEFENINNSFKKIQSDWPGHYNNDEFVRSPETWNYVISIIKSLFGDEYPNMVQEIAFNFGSWETRISKDKFAQDCHAHGHIILTSVGHEKLREKSVAYKKILSGRNNPIPNYDMIDAEELEKDRIFSLEMADMKKDLSDIKKAISDIKTIIPIMKDIKTVMEYIKNNYFIKKMINFFNY